MRSIVPALCALLLVLPVRADDTDALDRAMEILETMDRTMVRIEPTLHELEGALRSLQEHLPVPVRADWDALDRLGVRFDDEVTLAAERATVTDVLEGLMLQLADEFERPAFEVFANQIIITTVEATAEMRLTGVYDMRDLLADPSAVDTLMDRPGDAAAPPAAVEEAKPVVEDDEPLDLPDGKVAQADPPAPGADEEDKAPALDLTPPDIDDLPPRRLTPAEDLLLFIAEHVDPEGWLEYGGVRARITERNGVVLVSASATTHRMLRTVLERLRRVNPAALGIEAAIIDLDRDALRRLQRRHDAASPALARAVLEADEARTLWRNGATAVMDETMRVASAAAETEVVVELKARRQAGTGRVLLDVAAETTRGADRRTIATTTVVPLWGGGAVLELSGVETERARVLVLLTSRR
jgi:hypothetical protein